MITLRSFILGLTLFIGVFASIQAKHAEPDPDHTQPIIADLSEEDVVGTRYDSEEVLWLARCIYSETKRPEEMELVAWVVRNRVEAAYRGETTYKGVILDNKQFSAFNGGWKAEYYSSLLFEHADKKPLWKEAIDIAERVYLAPDSERKWPKNVLHFYSPQSMKPIARVPDWAHEKKLVKPPVPVSSWRFLFFATN